MAGRLTPEEWGAVVADVLSAQPELAAVTVNAMQAGILEAQERQLERIAVLSMGLVEALNTKPGQVKRRGDVIVRAIEASTVRGSEWGRGMIEREGA